MFIYIRVVKLEAKYPTPTLAFNNVAVFFNRGSTEPQSSVSSCQGFHRNRPKLPGMKFVYYKEYDKYLGHCIGFHEQHKYLRKVPVQQKGWKTLISMFFMMTNPEMQCKNRISDTHLCMLLQIYLNTCCNYTWILVYGCCCKYING